jgi:Co/Zn/Cd efflux system component
MACLVLPSGELLDRQASVSLREKIQEAIEADNDARVTDLHAWYIGPEIYSVQIAVVADNPMTPADYKLLLPQSLGLVHIAVKIHTCTGPGMVC